MVYIHIYGVERDYRLRPIEDLADLVHPMAAVAWDRDQDQLLLDRPLVDNVPMPLRFTTNCRRAQLNFGAMALTKHIGEPSNVVAVWDDVNMRWVSWRDRPISAVTFKNPV